MQVQITIHSPKVELFSITLDSPTPMQFLLMLGFGCGSAIERNNESPQHCLGLKLENLRIELEIRKHIAGDEVFNVSCGAAQLKDLVVSFMENELSYGTRKSTPFTFDMFEGMIVGYLVDNYAEEILNEVDSVQESFDTPQLPFKH